MAYTTFLAGVNQLLEAHGEQPIADASTFNTTSTLPKIQLQARHWFKIAHSIVMATPRCRFTMREWTITTSDGVNSYALDSTTTAEQLREEDWVITTSGEGALVKNRPYEIQRKLYPTGQTDEGRPAYWYLLPRSSNTETDYVAFCPIPDDTYTIKYLGWPRGKVLSVATDEIQLEPCWEFVLLLWAGLFLEIAKGEGKSGDFANLVEQMKSEMKQNTLGPPQESPHLDVGIAIYPFVPAGDYECDDSYLLSW